MKKLSKGQKIAAGVGIGVAAASAAGVAFWALSKNDDINNVQTKYGAIAVISEYDPSEELENMQCDYGVLPD